MHAKQSTSEALSCHFSQYSDSFLSSFIILVQIMESDALEFRFSLCSDAFAVQILTLLLLVCLPVL